VVDKRAPSTLTRNALEVVHHTPRRSVGPTGFTISSPNTATNPGSRGVPIGVAGHSRRAG
jgi:hypothetical protein